jgi:hypothetical protein
MCRRPASRSARLSPEQVRLKELAGEKNHQRAHRGAPMGGLKVLAQNGRFLARPSGTEDVYKNYAEELPRRGDPSSDRRRRAGHCRLRHRADIELPDKWRLVMFKALSPELLNAMDAWWRAAN